MFGRWTFAIYSRSFCNFPKPREANATYAASIA
jgi:hypothetical protein